MDVLFGKRTRTKPAITTSSLNLKGNLIYKGMKSHDFVKFYKHEEKATARIQILKETKGKHPVFL